MSFELVIQVVHSAWSVIRVIYFEFNRIERGIESDEWEVRKINSHCQAGMENEGLRGINVQGLDNYT